MSKPILKRIFKIGYCGEEISSPTTVIDACQIM